MSNIEHPRITEVARLLARAEAAEAEVERLKGALTIANEDAQKLAIRLEGESNLVVELSNRLAAHATWRPIAPFHRTTKDEAKP